MGIDSETSKKIQELQGLEQNSQGFLMQKQSHQVELNEVVNALEELKNSDDEVYKIISGMMIRSDKKSLSSELEEKKRILELKVSSIEKQEAILDDKIEKLRADINTSLTPDKK